MLFIRSKIYLYGLILTLIVPSIYASSTQKKENATCTFKLRPNFMGGPRIIAFDKKSSNESGFVQCYVLGDHKGEIERLYVSPSSRKKGIGSMLVQAAIHMLCQKGCTSIKIKPFPFQASNKEDFDKKKKLLVSFYGTFGFSYQ